MARAGVADSLSSAIGRRDESPNIMLAEKIVRTKNKSAITELLAILSGNNKALRSNAIKVLYEIGERQPKLIAPYAKEFIALTRDKDNRIQWGAMTALQSMALLAHSEIGKALSEIIKAARMGSVITLDNCLKLLVKLARLRTYKNKAQMHILMIIKTCPENQLPMYAELAVSVLTGEANAEFARILTKRLMRISKASKKKRLQNVLREIN